MVDLRLGYCRDTLVPVAALHLPHSHLVDLSQPRRPFQEALSVRQPERVLPSHIHSRHRIMKRVPLSRGDSSRTSVALLASSLYNTRHPTLENESVAEGEPLDMPQDRNTATRTTPVKTPRTLCSRL